MPIEESGLVGDELSMSVSQDKSFSEHAEVIVAGAVAIDLSCDFIPQKIANHSIDPLPRTSNSANITQSLGGVGQNVATALSYLGTSVRLCSIIAEDVAGSSILEMLAERGLSSKGIEKIRGSSTGRYIAINDSHKNLVLAMADMKILEERSDFGLRWKPHIDACKPKWLVVDANWEEDTLFNWIAKGKSSGARIAYEPVSTTKAKRLFTTLGSSSYEHDLEVFPNNALSLASPNSLELASMYAAAREAGVFDRESWWQIIDRMGMSSLGSRNKLTAITNSALVDEGVPQQSIQLLPFIPTIVTKLGERGVLLTELLQPDDKRLTSSASAPYILSHSAHDKKVGGVFMRLFAPIETVPQDQILSVNGVGDTFLGVLVAGLVRNRSVEAIIDVAQKGSVLTLKSKEAVSPDISTLHLF